MKITIINGSPRKNGNTAKVLKTMAARLTELGCEHIEYIDLVDCQITPCIGCAACYKTGSCVIHDDAEMINGHIAGSQGVIIGSPTYVSNVSGFLKTYIDRGHIVLEQSYRSKRVLPIVTYGVSGGGKVIKMLKNTT
ncbi:MAG TPA: flavodoxin family protein, partial [Coriobacteriia bacterium]|nr:flavodoxin family protein [Coriobacteriia bacterium]